ncbi:STAS domain-containing protein [Nocardia sp. NPDC049526]|uniref:STAS domain-containing protein n=1 Tax=Nocardia sp. NPDC049526 TaxID=3364316 RepID=UPI0037980904
MASKYLAPVTRSNPMDAGSVGPSIPEFARGGISSPIDGRRRPRTAGVRVVRTRPCVGVTLYSVLGEVDSGTVAEFERQLLATLHTAAPTIVIDLSELGFLGVAGLEVLDDARAWSRYTHEMYLVTGTGCADHVIAASGMTACLDTFANLDDALREVAKRHGHG